MNRLKRMMLIAIVAVLPFLTSGCNDEDLGDAWDAFVEDLGSTFDNFGDALSDLF